LLEGMAGNAEAVRQTLSALAVVRSPAMTTVLEDLERDYGILSDLTLGEDIRRARLAVAKSGTNSDGSAATLQGALRGAGFDLYVHENSPLTDPATIPGELVVNGDTYEHSYYGAVTSGDIDAVTGFELAVCGNQASFEQRAIAYGTQPDGRLVFFVGGEATRAVGGEMTAVARALVPASRRAELISMIVRYKPMHTWCVLCVDLVDDDGMVLFAFNDGSVIQFDDNTAVLGRVE